MTKTILSSIAFALLAALGASQSVSAQTALKAQIPLPFRAAGAYLPAGEYTVSVAAANGRSFLRNNETRHGIFLTHSYQLESRRDGNPRLVFSCVEGACTLSQFWTGARSGVQLPVPRTPANREQLIATRNIPLKR